MHTLYQCQNCGMPLEMEAVQCWICSHKTDFTIDLVLFKVEDEPMQQKKKKRLNTAILQLFRDEN